MENQPILILTVGLPRSGKSSWARSTGLPVVNPDSIRLAIHGQAFYAPAEPLVWAHAHLMVKALFMSGAKTVILDATNVSERRRNEWRSNDWGLAFVCFKTDKETCIERAHANGQEDLAPVIERMARDLVWPTEDLIPAIPGPSPNFLHYRVGAVN